MEYNNNVYLTISHDDCIALNLDGNHRTNNDDSICIMEYPTMEAIPQEVSDVLIATYTHEEALALVEQADWITDSPFNI